MIEKFTQRSKMHSAWSVEKAEATAEELTRHPICAILRGIEIRQRTEDSIAKDPQVMHLIAYKSIYDNDELQAVIISSTEVVWNCSLLFGNKYFSSPEHLNESIIDDLFIVVRPSVRTLDRYHEAARIAKKLTNNPELELEEFNGAVQRGVIVVTEEYKKEKERKRQLQAKKEGIRARIAAMKAVRIKKQRERNEVVLREVLAKAGEQVHPGRWDVEEVVGKQKTLYLTIYFPEINITNSKKQKHTIHDLYVMFGVDLDGKALNTLYGRRGSLTYAEWKSEYPQSHLTSNAIKDIGSFCLGDANIVTLLSDMSRESYFKAGDKWVRRLEAILFQMEAFMSWESIEGTPYYYIGSIAVPGEIRVDHVAESAKIISRLSPSDPPPMIFVKGRGFQLSSNTEQFEDWLLKYTNCVQFKDDRGSFYTDSNASLPKEDFEVPDSKSFIFRGQEIKRLVRVKKHETQERKEYCHRQVKNEFVAWANRELERGFTERSLRSIFRGILTTKAKSQASSYTLENQGKPSAQSEFKSVLKGFKAVSALPRSGMVGDNVVQNHGRPG